MHPEDLKGLISLYDTRTFQKKQKGVKDRNSLVVIGNWVKMGKTTCLVNVLQPSSFLYKI